MPSHKIHIAIAQKVNEVLKLDNDEISLGAVLPDLAKVKHHGISHFQHIKKYPDNLANPEEFIKKYGVCDTISMGYLIHLLTDRFYNEKYYRKFFVFKDNIPIKLVIKTEEIDEKKGRAIKHHEFLEYDKYLINNNMIIPFKNKDVVKKIPKYKDMEFDINYLEKYIDKSNKELENKRDYKFLYWTKNELDNIFSECIKYVIDYIKSKL